MYINEQCVNELAGSMFYANLCRCMLIYVNDCNRVVWKHQYTLSYKYRLGHAAGRRLLNLRTPSTAPSSMLKRPTPIYNSYHYLTSSVWRQTLGLGLRARFLFQRCHGLKREWS